MNKLSDHHPETDEPVQQDVCHYVASILVMYDRDGSPKQRHLNVLFEAASPHITKSDLSQINQAALRRVCTENKVEVSDIKDTVILNLVLLSILPSAVFHGEPLDEQEASPEPSTEE